MKDDEMITAYVSPPVGAAQAPVTAAPVREGARPPYIDHFEPEDTLVLEPVANEGWIVTIRSKKPGMTGECVGAFSNTADMLAALNAALAWRV